MDEKQLRKLFVEYTQNLATKDDVRAVEQKLDRHILENRREHEEMNEKLDELKASADSHDKLLEHNPVPRIERLEKHCKLSPFKMKLQAN